MKYRNKTSCPRQHIFRHFLNVSWHVDLLLIKSKHLDLVVGVHACTPTPPYDMTKQFHHAELGEGL